MKKKNIYTNTIKNKMDNVVTKLWFVIGFLILASLVTFTMYIFNGSISKNMNGGFEKTNENIDSIKLNQSEFLKNLVSINQKLDLNNEKVSYSISDLNLNVNKINRSVKRIGKNIDSIVVYIKK
jgi:peptidoglycan hydrolase CwlO-like protein